MASPAKRPSTCAAVSVPDRGIRLAILIGVLLTSVLFAAALVSNAQADTVTHGMAAYHAAFPDSPVTRARQSVISSDHGAAHQVAGAVADTSNAGWNGKAGITNQAISDQGASHIKTTTITTLSFAAVAKAEAKAKARARARAEKVRAFRAGKANALEATKMSTSAKGGRLRGFDHERREGAVGAIRPVSSQASGSAAWRLGRPS
jgi:hypothetical protein